MQPVKPHHIVELAPAGAPQTQPVALTSREQLILRSIIHNYILSATPLGSRSLARRFRVGLSPASIRNTMADLEEMGLLMHLHTSAGRIPTDLGYRLYVDDLMKVEALTDDVRRAFETHLEAPPPEVNELLQVVTQLLSQVSHLLAVIMAPDISAVTLNKIELLRVASGRIMVVVVVSTGLVRTIILEVSSVISDDEIAAAAQFINQRLSGMRLADIARSISDRISGEEASRNAIVRLFLDLPGKIFEADRGQAVYVEGARFVLDLPEYSQPERMRGIIELIDDQDIIVHLLKERKEGVSVTIGEEHPTERLKDLSVITSTYRMGGAQGTVGIIGPTRMNYSRLVALVDYAAQLVSEKSSRAGLADSD